jgi:two-component system phosphate regulon response regulator PhoB
VARILFVEDDVNLLQAIAFILEREGFEVSCATRGDQVLELASVQPPDLVLLDVNLPGLDGFEVCRKLKSTPATSRSLVVLLTARGEVEDVVHGFESLADDYVTKPCHPRALLARLQTLLRRGSAAAAATAPLRRGELSIDCEGRVVRVNGERIELTRTEFDLLRLLATHVDQVLSRERILDCVRSDPLSTGERAVDVQIVGLRKKLGTAARHIETVRGIGYRFSA